MTGRTSTLDQLPDSNDPLSMSKYWLATGGVFR